MKDTILDDILVNDPFKDEEILWEGKPEIRYYLFLGKGNPFFIMLYGFLFIVFVVFVRLILEHGFSVFSLLGIAVFLGLVIVLLLLFPILDLLNLKAQKETEYIISENYVYIKSGFLRKKKFYFEKSQIRDIKVVRFKGLDHGEIHFKYIPIISYRVFDFKKFDTSLTFKLQHVKNPNEIGELISYKNESSQSFK